MAQRRHHYEQAFEQYLRCCRIPYVAVDEARKTLVPDSPGFRDASLKSFDFVIYGPLGAHDSQGTNLLVEVKGRRLARRKRSRGTPGNLWRPGAGARLDAWVTMEDVRSLRAWEALFGPEFKAAFVFVFWCDEQPADALFTEVFESRSRWYALRAVSVAAYSAAMRTRSSKWGTVHVLPRAFEEISQPLTLARGASEAPILAGPGAFEVPWGVGGAPDPGPTVPAIGRG